MAGNIGKGHTLGYSAIPATTYTAVAQIQDGGFPTATVGSHEVTISDDAGVKRIPGFPDAESVTFQCLYVKAGYNTILGLKGLDKTWKETLPDGSTMIWTGFITSVGMPVMFKDVLRYSVTIDVSDANSLAFTPAA